MNSTYETAINAVFQHEGGFTNEATDPGGATNWGITIEDARLYWKQNATEADMRAMPKSVAQEIYRKEYAARIRYNELPGGVDYSVLDYAINSGVGRAGKVLRRLVNLPDDTSVVTDAVLGAVARRSPSDLINAISDERLAFLRQLKIWPTYKDGWTRRVKDCRALSLSFAKRTPAPSQELNPSRGKGKVPEPKTAKKIIVGAGTGGGITFIGFAHKHPLFAAMAGISVVMAVGIALHAVSQRHEAQQHAATPGIEPVKEAA